MADQSKLHHMQEKLLERVTPLLKDGPMTPSQIAKAWGRMRNQDRGFTEQFLRLAEAGYLKYEEVLAPSGRVKQRLFSLPSKAKSPAKTPSKKTAPPVSIVDSPKWAAPFLGKTISNDAVESANREGAGLSVGGGTYKTTFKSKNGCEHHMAEVALTVQTKDKAIKRVKTEVCLVEFNPPMFNRIKVDSDPLGEDMKYILGLLKKITC